jgi:multidrug efflux pump subunit AcrA (membrane-fusion protein)
MSVNAEIIAYSKKNILLIPNSAIKNDKDGNYAQIVKNYKIKKINSSNPVVIPKEIIEKRYIKTGISNDEFTEVIEGLKEGEDYNYKNLKSNSKK